ncbi:unnamed protein product, partial [marine sediment metagenome]
TVPQIVYGDTPLEVRGWIAAEDANLPAWIWSILNPPTP